MPLVLNLHHEIDLTKTMQRRDPLKMAGYALIAIGVGFAGYYVFELQETHSVTQQFELVDRNYKTLQPKAEAAKKREDELNVTIKASEALVKHTESRFYWAPLLDAVTAVVPREVQLTRFNGEMTGERTKHCAVTIDGVATGIAPRKTTDELRQTIVENFTSKFRKVTSDYNNLTDTTETAKLDGRQMPTVDFSIIIHFEAGEEEATPPPVTLHLKKKF